MPRDVSLSDSKCCENATVGKNGLNQMVYHFEVDLESNGHCLFAVRETNVSRHNGGTRGATTVGKNGLRVGVVTAKPLKLVVMNTCKL